MIAENSEENWKEIETYIESDDLPISYKLVGELLMDAVERPDLWHRTEYLRELASKAFLKIENVAWRLEMLIAYEHWELAIDEMCKARVTDMFEK